MTLAIFAAFYYCLFNKKDFTKNEDVFKLDFVPKKQNFSCDELFTNSEVDFFNFSKHYYQDLPLFTNEIKRINKYGSEGHSGMFYAQYKTLHYLAAKSFVNSICETGFNYGHSSFAFITAKTGNKVLSFDIGKHDNTIPLMKYMKKTYPNNFRYVIGDSTKTIITFVNENPSYKCDMIFVDGGHTYEVAYSDLKSFKRLSEANNIVVLDDYPTRDKLFDDRVGKAWQRAKDEKIVEELMRCFRQTDNFGFTIGRFI